MPFVSQEDWDNLLTDNMRLSGELHFYRNMSGVIGLAQLLQSEISLRLENEPGMTASEIGEAAYLSVYATGVEAARRQRVTEYEEQHRSDLYARVVEEVEAEEGETLFEAAKRKIESDPDLMLKLRESARNELAQRAYSTVSDTITAEQEQHFAEETERQITLDRFDVEFAIDGELDLNRDDITASLRTGDTLILTYTTPASGYEQRLTLRWTADAKGREGWTLENYGPARIKGSDGYYREPRDLSKFLVIGSVQNDLVEGTKMDVPNVLKQGSPILLGHEVTKGKKEGEVRNLDVAVPTSGSYAYGTPNYLLLKTVDFRTRTLYFNGK